MGEGYLAVEEVVVEAIGMGDNVGWEGVGVGGGATFYSVDCFIKSLFDWSRAQGFTSSNIFTQFIDSVSLDPHRYTLVII